MILEAIFVGLSALAITVAGYLLIQGAVNHQRQQSFRQKAKGLPFLENPSIFGGHALKYIHNKRNTQIVTNLTKEYGSTFALCYGNKPMVITVDLDFIKQFTLDEPEHINRMIPDIPFEEMETDNIMFSIDDQWKRIRSAIAPAFSAHKIKSDYVSEEINSVIDRFIGLIERRLKAAKETRGEDFIVENTDDICHRYALALVFTCFYKQDEVIDFHSDKDYHVDLIDKGLRNMICFSLKLCTALPIIKPLVSWCYTKFDEQGLMAIKIMDHIKQQTKQYFEARKQFEELKIKGDQKNLNPDNFILKDGSKFRRNMVDHIIDQYREGKLTRREYFNSTLFLFLAANKTSSDAISKCLYHLACNQHIQEKLRKTVELEGFESEYLSWVVNESLRLFPPAPIGCSRQIKRDIQTKSGLVPAGTFVATPVSTISRLPEYWGEDANEFKPERWANSKNFHPAQYLVFGLGRRACPGKALALLETKMLLCALLRNYKFEKSEQTNDENLFQSPLFVFLVFDKPTKIKISRLDSNST